MLKKRNFFNTTTVTKEEFEDYIHRGFVDNPEFKNEVIFYRIVFIILIIFCSASLIQFYKLRYSYIIHKRGFNLTFWGGIMAFLDIVLSFLPQIMEVPCALSVYQANLINVLVNLIFFCRSLRIILFYYYNVYKVTYVKKNNKRIAWEPNHYFSKLIKKIKNVLIAVIIIPTIISFLITVIIHLTKSRDECSFIELEDAMLGLKLNKGRNLFFFIQIFGVLYTILSLVMTILLSFIKDSDVFANVINIIVQVNASTNFDYNTESSRRIYLDIFEITKGGKLLFTIVSIYILITSISLPLIHYYKAKIANRRYIEEDLTSKSFFNKVLNVPSLIDELRNIAIKEFSVENVLFWENYRILQSMIYRYYTQFKKAQELGNDKLINQYDFEGYYQEQVNSFSKSSIDGDSIDTNAFVPKPIVPYYINFYKTFIDSNGHAPVNILGQTVIEIRNGINFPTVGIFDQAKDEVTDLMYSSIYPILLNKYEKYIINTIN